MNVHRRVKDPGQRFVLRDGGLPCELRLDDDGLAVSAGAKKNVSIPWPRLAHLYCEHAFLDRFEVMLLGYQDDHARPKILRVYADTGDPVLTEAIAAIVHVKPAIDRRMLTRRAAYGAVGIRSFAWMRRAAVGMVLLVVASVVSEASLRRLAHPEVVLVEAGGALPVGASYVRFKDARLASDAVMLESVRQGSSSRDVASYAAVVPKDQVCGRALYALRTGAPRKPTAEDFSDGQSVVAGRYDDVWGSVPALADQQQWQRRLENTSYEEHRKFLERARASGAAGEEREASPPPPDCTTFDRDVAIFDAKLTPARDKRVVAFWFSSAVALGIGAFFFRRSRKARPRAAEPRSPFPYR